MSGKYRVLIVCPLSLVSKSAHHVTNLAGLGPLESCIDHGRPAPRAIVCGPLGVLELLTTHDSYTKADNSVVVATDSSECFLSPLRAVLGMLISRLSQEHHLP